MVNFRARVSLAVVALTLGACGEGLAPEQREVNAASVGAALGGPNCPSVLCGDNNGVGNVPFYELDASMREENSAGLRIIDFASPKFGSMKVRVEGDRLIGLGGDGDIEGEALVGSWFTLSDKGGNIGRLVIERYDTIDYKVAPDPSNRVPLYSFVYHPNNIEIAPYELCRNTLTDPDYGTIKGSAIIFSGDRYDAGSLSVTETGPESSWFNIGCPGTGAMKMHLFRHTLAGGNHAYKTKVSQRQTLLKMFGADYCGTGKNFTVDGQPIAFNFDQGWLPRNWGIDFTSPDYKAPEAIWRDDGASCLTMPRRADATPGIELDIAAECNAAGHVLPPCKEADLEAWKEHGYAVTMNPAPPSL